MTLADARKEGPKTYLGLGVDDFPNMFLIACPGSPSVLTNVVGYGSIEQHVEWIVDYITHLHEHGILATEPTSEAAEEWGREVNQIAEATLDMKAGSWYLGADIPAKPREFMPYAGRRCEEVAGDDYRGFT